MGLRVLLAEGSSVIPDFLVPAHLMRQDDAGSWQLLCREAAGDPADGARLNYLCSSCSDQMRLDFRAGVITVHDIPDRWIRSLIMTG